MPKKPHLVLIDGSSQMFRAYHAIRSLTGPDGKSTNAVYGFVIMLRKLISEFRPDLIAAAFDVKGPTFRNEIDPNYKANRSPTPPDLVEQIPWVHAACEALGVPVLTHENYEADDIIGTLALRAVEAKFDVSIITGDKDFFQLVRKEIRVFNPRDEGTWFDATAVKKKFGVAPSQVIDVLSLMGDAVDNVKGVPGIGKKGACALISTHHSLDSLLSNISGVSQKRYRTALEKHHGAALKSRELVRIETDAPVSFNPTELRYNGPSTERCFSLFSNLGFKTLITDFAPTVETVEKDYGIIRTDSQLRTLIANVVAAGRAGIELLTDSSSATLAPIVGISVSIGPNHARYIPMGHQLLGSDTTVDHTKVLNELKGLLGDQSILKVGHDLKVASLILGRHNVPLEGLDLDTLLASYLLGTSRGAHQFEELALDVLGYKAISEAKIIGTGKKAAKFSDMPVEAVAELACERSDLVLQIGDQLSQKLKNNGLDSLYRDLELPLVPVLADIEQIGIFVDTKTLAELSAKLGEELLARQAEIHTFVGETFNINSPKQLSVILFEKLQLPKLKRTGKTKVASTSVDVLEELALMHELPRKVLEWRSLSKLKGTYLDALPQLVNPETGRVHTSFNQAVAATGRLSSSDPNLQNIPIRTELGRKIRAAFKAAPGMVLISADYSQIELRVLAHLSRDENLIDAFENGEDIHNRTARRVFGTDSKLDPHELRRRAKMINYALLYGKTAYTLAKDIRVTPQAAQAFIDTYFEGFPSVRMFIDQTLSEARKTGVVTTVFNRRRHLPELSSHNHRVRSAAERAAVNMPIQGTAADILKRAMIDIHAALPTDSSMILTVHDELLFEVPKAKATEVANFVRERMENAVQLAVPLTVDVGIGKNWKEAKG